MIKPGDSRADVSPEVAAGIMCFFIYYREQNEINMPPYLR